MTDVPQKISKTFLKFSEQLFLKTSLRKVIPEAAVDKLLQKKPFFRLFFIEYIWNAASSFCLL